MNKNDSIKKVLNYQIGNHVTVTQLSRSTQWRNKLEHREIMEVLDRTETIAILLHPDVYENLCKYIKELEQKMET